jgi:hypothetical protein
METQVKAQQAGATIEKTTAQAMGEQLDNQKKMADMIDEQQRKMQLAALSDFDLARIAAGATSIS